MVSKHKYIKPKPETTNINCLTCGKLLKDFEIMLGCSHCKIENKKDENKTFNYKLHT
jgi:hypothetical protein